jgi:death-on-curing protein
VSEPRWLSGELVRTIHAQSLARFGGEAGLRSEEALDAALAKPRQVHAYGSPDLFRIAAAYASGLVRQHPFFDGNKRVGFLAAYVFLGLNGHRLIAPEEEAVLQILSLARAEGSDEELAAWLEQYSVPG